MYLTVGQLSTTGVISSERIRRAFESDEPIKGSGAVNNHQGEPTLTHHSGGLNK